VRLEAPLDLNRMLDKCHRFQWEPGDLDWSVPPREMERDDEIAICQYFTDMAGIERLASALFVEQMRKTEDPVLKEIFASFVKDELRHAQVAQMLADHYDVHHYKFYELNPALRRFAPAFVKLIRFLSPEIANTYVTSGELILDVALLRSIDDYVNDSMSSAAMHLINRDESRHIAVDFHMIEYYSSDEWIKKVEQQPAQTLSERVRSFRAMAKVIWYAKPFFRGVFFDPMGRVDPSGKRLREAFKRIQLLAEKPQVRRRPFVRFMAKMRELYNDPVVGTVLGRLLVRITGVEPRWLETLFTDEEAAKAATMSFDELAADALGAKYAVA